ncbi:STAS domain-containing protein [Streptomyces lavendofoliae]|uniref:STAS domain-containing protein n=1 Tax=Streptomyces lavendofoliae TaxID=67314 RepID=UPI003D8AB77F
MSEAALDVRYSVRHGQGTISMAGEIDLTTADQLRQAASACLAKNPMNLHVDFTDVTFCDCSGLNALLWAYRQARQQGTAMHLRGLQPPVARLFDVTGTTPLFRLRDVA